ncbi:hypothetical protein EW026_g7078 [Hermanssonia centrifuga]|uniref:ATP-dependent rRNA helicase RRP3 n=1 Tax=Hermanssonia centrifuga TaxID=98765 RepID=A0A4V3X9J0_9APHY|nr:hypothetical protein EW026_g7078 [Hermanssonia centrifuga]
MPAPEEASTSTAAPTTFKSLGLIDPLLEAISQLNYTVPTEIQTAALPHALEGRDIIGVASTGSGKTAAFALPILQKLWEDPKGLFACVLAPTRELAYQISQQFESLGSAMGVRCATIVGGMDMMSQSVALAKRPHIVVATPGRLQDHLENTKGFSLRSLQFLVLDEADRLLDMDFGPIIDKILKVIPQNRTTYLFSATMTTKVAKLQRASLSNPVRVEVSENQSARLGALGKFKSGGRRVLVATDVASRGLDIPHVDVVINYDIPTHSKDYIHRVGRTARAGRSGKSVTLVSQYDVELLQRIETVLGKKMEQWPTDAEEIALLRERVDEASRVAVHEMKDQARSGHGRKRAREEGGGKDDRDRDDDTVEAGMPKKKSKGRR